MDVMMAWRNIWRNPRRTAVILTAVVIGVWSMVFLGALMRGNLEGMIHNGIQTLTGHIQIHQTGYPDDPSIVHRIEDPAAIIQTLKTQLPPGSRWTTRIRVNAVAGNARHSGGVTLVGIAPAAEAGISFIGSAVREGGKLQAEDPNAILVGAALAEQFETALGRKLILMSQAADGRVVSRAFRIRGIFRAEMESTEKNFVFVTYRAARDMLGMGPAVSEIAILLPDSEMARATARSLEDTLAGRGVVVRPWQDALPLLKAYLEMYDTFILIWFLVVFVAMGFGILNTTLMAVFERMREFGLLKALGMRPGRIVKGILTEAFLILGFGVAIGNVLGLGSCGALAVHGIDLSGLAQGAEYAGMPRVIYPVVAWQDVVGANLVVLLLGLLVCLYPAVKAARFTPLEAMTHT
ncbi:MAG: FtsX-like permease family protein [Desulfobacteraceae bacterium]|jgi:ABC-type lipoprotein release transport system permease subunit|nr:FtsX-like permease family protein [Desulfobacteraceae bacterium]